MKEKKILTLDQEIEMLEKKIQKTAKFIDNEEENIE